MLDLPGTWVFTDIWIIVIISQNWSRPFVLGIQKYLNMSFHLRWQLVLFWLSIQCLLGTLKESVRNTYKVFLFVPVPNTGVCIKIYKSPRHFGFLNTKVKFLYFRSFKVRQSRRAWLFSNSEKKTIEGINMTCVFIVVKQEVPRNTKWQSNSAHPSHLCQHREWPPHDPVWQAAL